MDLHQYYQQDEATNFSLEVATGEYYYLPKTYIKDYITGFITKDVRDCICGLISSDQGYAFFHFFRNDDPKDLAEKIKKDFKNSTSVKILLIGGNLINSFLPWKEKNRELKYLSDDKTTNSSGLQAMELMSQRLNVDSSFNTVCELTDPLKKEEMAKLLKECVTKTTQKNLFEYNYDSLNRKLSEKDFLVSGFFGQCTFRVRSTKDFIGYQNLAKVMHVLTVDTKLFNKHKIKHLHCKPGYLVKANFNGTCRAESFYNNNPLSCHFLTTRNVDGMTPSKIKNTNQFFDNRYLKNKTEI